MKLQLITYWAATPVVTLVMGISGGMAIAHLPSMMKGLAHLGYPPYFSNILGAGKTIGLVVLLVPGLPRLKEWAYAGFAITIVSACYSHYSSGDGWLALEPLVTLMFLMVSYVTRPPNRRLASIAQ
jgi:DoxX-like family